MPITGPLIQARGEAGSSIPQPHSVASRLPSRLVRRTQPTCSLAPTGIGHGVLGLQRLLGNTAVGNLLSGHVAERPVRHGPSSPGTLVSRQSINDVITAGTGIPASVHAVTAEATIAAHQTLPSPPGKTIHTDGATQVRVSATAGGLSISFSPHLVITNHDPRWYVPDVDIWVHGAEWSFATQRLSVSWTARNIVNWVGDPGTELLAAMSSAISSLPGRMRAAGYNPFADPELPADLTAFAARLSSGAGPGGALPRMSGGTVEASFSLADEVRRSAGDGVTIVVPARSTITVRATLGGIPARPADLRISGITLSLSEGARINLRALGQDWPVIDLQSATVLSGGRISANYRIVHEDIGTALLQLLAAAQVASDPLSAGQIRDDLTVRDEAAHRLIDRKMREQLEPMLRTLIINNAGAVPGLDLRQVFGIE